MSMSPMRSLSLLLFFALSILIPAALAGCTSTEQSTASATIRYSLWTASHGDVSYDPRYTSSNSVRIEAELEYLVSDDLVLTILDTESVQTTGWFRSHADNLDAALSDAQVSVLFAEHLPGMPLVRLSVTAPDDEDALAILSTWVRAYSQDVARRVEPLIAARSILETDIVSIELKIIDTEADMRRHLIEHPRRGDDLALAVIEQEAMFLNAKKAELETLVSLARATHQQLREATLDSFEPTQDDIEVINESERITRLDEERASIEAARRKILFPGMDESHPDVLEFETALRENALHREREFDVQVRLLHNARIETSAMAAAIFEEQLAAISPRLDALIGQIESSSDVAAERWRLIEERSLLETERDILRQAIRESNAQLHERGFRVDVTVSPVIVSP